MKFWLKKIGDEFCSYQKTLSLFFTIIFFSTFSYADEFNGIVEVEQVPLVGSSYKERRTSHGFLFGLSYKAYYPKNYLSMYDGLEIKEFFGSSPIQIPEVMLGYKHNFSLGSVSLTGHFSSGSDESDYQGNSRYLSVNIYEGNASFYLDNITQEPYVVPYAGIGIQQIDLKEQSADLDMKSAASGWSWTYRLGLQFQLNWLDKQSSQDGYREVGLENMYLDLYAVSYDAGGGVAENPSDPNDTGKPDLSSEMQLGVGLKLEF